MIDPSRATTEDLATLLAISMTHVRNLRSKGVFQKVEGLDRYDLGQSFRNYLQYKLDQRRAAVAASGLDDKDALVAEQTRKLRLANDRSEGMLLPAEDVLVAVDAVAAAFRQHLDTLPGRLAAELAGVTEPALVKERLMDECRRILLDTARHLERVAKPPPVAPTEDEPRAGRRR